MAKKDKRTRTERFIYDRTSPVTKPVVFGTPLLEPYSFLIKPFTWKSDTLVEVAKSLGTSKEGVFFDSNVLIRDDFASFWTTAFSVGTDLLIAPVVLRELEEWIDEPFRKEELAAEFRRARHSESGHLRLAAPKSPERFNGAMEWYRELLGVRRVASLLAPEDMDDGQKLNWVRDNFGERTSLLAKKGRDAIANAGILSVGDEDLVLQAVFYAIFERQPVTIITADADVLEIFFKTQNLLDTHARAYLYGEKVHLDRLLLERVEAKGSLAKVFDGEVRLWKGVSPDRTDVSMPVVGNAAVTCAYFGPNANGVIAGFGFDWSFGQVLESVQTNMPVVSGRFGGDNVVLDLAGLGQNSLVNCVAIGRERTMSLRVGGPAFGVSDVNLVLHSDERMSNAGVRFI